MCMKMLGIDPPASAASWCSTRVSRVIAGVPPAIVSFATLSASRRLGGEKSGFRRLESGSSPAKVRILTEQPKMTYLALNERNACNPGKKSLTKSDQVRPKISGSLRASAVKYQVPGLPSGLSDEVPTKADLRVSAVKNPGHPWLNPSRKITLNCA